MVVQAYDRTIWQLYARVGTTRYPEGPREDESDSVWLGADCVPSSVGIGSTKRWCLQRVVVTVGPDCHGACPTPGWWVLRRDVPGAGNLHVRCCT